MAIINLRDFYPFYQHDYFVDVPEAIVAALAEAERRERSYIRRVLYNKAQYSLDAGDGIENDALFLSLSPYEVYERKLTMGQLYSALAALPQVQWRRVYAHYILGMSKISIAKHEGVSEKSVRQSIERGLRRMEEILKNS